MKMNVGIIGSRDFQDRVLIFEMLDRFHKNKSITRVVSGGADGADTIGADWAIVNDIPLTEYPADWKNCGPECPPNHQKKGRYGWYCPTAGMRRNTDIQNDSDAIIAFWKNRSRGTHDTIKKAVKAGKTVWVIEPNGHYYKYGD
jgi:hypothetical protein